MSAAPAWLVARPIAHRGLHGEGVAENSLGAARAAVAHGFGIECDVRLTADGEAIVFHDATLDRLTGQSGLVAERSSVALGAVTLRTGGERIPTFAALLEAIGGRVPLICEVKSEFDGDMRLAERVRALLAGYPGPVAVKSFDPAPIAHLRVAPPCPLGIVAEAVYDHPEWDALSPEMKRDLAQVLHFDRTRPDFLSYAVYDLPHAVPFLCRTMLGLPLITWTVRTAEARATATRWADQIVFEGFMP